MSGGSSGSAEGGEGSEGSGGAMFCLDLDGDGFGDASICLDFPAPGHVPNADDCDDGSAATFPGAAPADGPECMLDADGDGYGDAAPANPDVTAGTDCDDSDGLAFPGAAFEEGGACMLDADGDGYGDATPANPDVTAGTDCDDADVFAFPGAAFEEGGACMLDADGDGYGDANPGNPAIVPGLDCDDGDSLLADCAPVCVPVGPNLSCGGDMESLDGLVALQACVQADVTVALDVGLGLDLDGGVLTTSTAAILSLLPLVSPFVDHTTLLDSGRVALAASTGLLDELLYGEIVDVEPNTDYMFTAYVRTANALATPVLDVRFNGVSTTETAVVFDPDPEGWVEIQRVWNSGPATEVTVDMVNRLALGANNIIMIDDVYFGTCALHM